MQQHLYSLLRQPIRTDAMPIWKEGWETDEQEEQDMFQGGWDIQVHEQGEGKPNGTEGTKHGNGR